MFSLPKVTQLFHDRSIGPVKITPVILRVVLKNDGVRTANNFAAVRARHYYVLYYLSQSSAQGLMFSFIFQYLNQLCEWGIVRDHTHSVFFFFLYLVQFGYNSSSAKGERIRAFEKWVAKEFPDSDKDPEHPDAAVLITRRCNYLFFFPLLFCSVCLNWTLIRGKADHRIV